MIKIEVELTEVRARELIERERFDMKRFSDPFQMDEEQLLKYFIFGAIIDRYAKHGMLIDQIDFQYELAGDKILVSGLDP